MLILNADDVRRALPMSQAVAAMNTALRAISSRSAIAPPRSHLDVTQHSGVTLVMPALMMSGIDAVSSRDGAEIGDVMAVKVVSVFDRNPSVGLPRIQASVLVVDPSTGTPQALLSGSMLTAIRTAAASGAATDVLARKDASRLALIGSGVEARSHLRAMLAVRPIRSVRVYSPTRANVDALIAEMSQHPDVGPHVELLAADSARDAIHDAHIICTVSTSTTPVFADDDVPDGVHINAVGSFKPHVVEIPPETVLRALVCVDSREAAWDEAGDLIQPLRAGLITEAHVRAEAGELLARGASLRTDDRQITLFKSVGHAVEDAAAASIVLANARRLELGTTVRF